MYAANPTVQVNGQDKILAHAYLDCGCRVDMLLDPSYAEGQVDDYRSDLWIYGKYLDRHPYKPNLYKLARRQHDHRYD